MIAIHHGFGGLSTGLDEFLKSGSSVSRLISVDVDYDPITGLPRQGNIPVRVAPRNG